MTTVTSRAASSWHRNAHYTGTPTKGYSSHTTTWPAAWPKLDFCPERELWQDEKGPPWGTVPHSLVELGSFLKCRVWFCGTFGQRDQDHSNRPQNIFVRVLPFFGLVGGGGCICSSSGFMKIRQKLSCGCIPRGRG